MVFGATYCCGLDAFSTGKLIVQELVSHCIPLQIYLSGVRHTGICSAHYKNYTELAKAKVGAAIIIRCRPMLANGAAIAAPAV